MTLRSETFHKNFYGGSTGFARKVRCTVISLCNLCVLCVSVVSFGCKSVNHRDTEDAEVAQRRAICWLFVQSRS